MCPSEPTHFQSGETKDQFLVRSAKHVLISRMADPPTLKELADTLQVGKKRLQRVFRMAVGMTLAQYLREERMRRAQRLLLQTSMGVEAIAREVGFSGAANFSNAFHRYVGTPPSVFREQAPIGQLTSLQGALLWDSASDAV